MEKFSFFWNAVQITIQNIQHFGKYGTVFEYDSGNEFWKETVKILSGVGITMSKIENTNFGKVDP